VASDEWALGADGWKAGVGVINEPPVINTKDDAIKLLREAAEEAFCFIENYCSCTTRNVAAKKLRIALLATKEKASDA
jgi:hypothetical protein